MDIGVKAEGRPLLLDSRSCFSTVMAAFPLCMSDEYTGQRLIGLDRIFGMNLCLPFMNEVFLSARANLSCPNIYECER